MESSFKSVSFVMEGSNHSNLAKVHHFTVKMEFHRAKAYSHIKLREMLKMKVYVKKKQLRWGMIFKILSHEKWLN